MMIAAPTAPIMPAAIAVSRPAAFAGGDGKQTAAASRTQLERNNLLF
jgi:hypothetical protein